VTLFRRYCVMSGDVVQVYAEDTPVCPYCQRIMEPGDPIFLAVARETRTILHPMVPHQHLCGRYTAHPKGTGPLSNGGDHCAMPAGHHGSCRGDAELEQAVHAAMVRR